MNKWQGYGRVAVKGEMKSVGEKNTQMINFTIATARKGQRGVSDFIRCTGWGKTAEIISSYVNVGNRLSVSGRIQTGSYERDGSKHYTVEVVVEEVDLVETKAENKASETNNVPVASPKEDDFVAIPDEIDDSELPFS